MPDVAVRNPDGKLVSIDAADLEAAKAQGYVEAAAPKGGVYEGAREKGYGPVAAAGLAVASPFLSWEQGAVEGATAGLGSGLQRKIAGVIGPAVSKLAGVDLTPEQAEAYYKEIAQGGAHPLIHGGGEMAGMVTSAVAAPALRGGGAAGTVGRGLGLLSEAGEGAAAGARALTGGLAARGVLGRAGAAAIEHGARGAIEMGLYEGVKELSEEALGPKPELNAEKLLMAAAGGAEGGAIFGGLLGGGGSLVKSGVSGTKSLVNSALSKNADALQDAANEQRWRALDPTLKYSREAAKIPGGSKGVGNTLSEYGVFNDAAAEAGEQAPEKLGFLGNVKKTASDLKAAGAAGDVDAIAPKIDAALEQVGQKIGEVRGASKATVTWGAIDDAIDSAIKPFRGKAGFEDVAGSLEKYRTSLANQLVPDIAALQTAKGAELTAEEYAKLMSRSAEAKSAPIALQDAIKQRQALDELVYSENAPLNPSKRVKALQDIRGKLEDVIMTSFDDAAKAAGDAGARAQLEKLKLDYRRLSVARNASQDSVERAGRNRMLSPTDYISGGIASNFGQAAGGLVAGGPGAWLGGLAGGALGAGINKYARTRGNAVAAAALDKLSAAGRGKTVAALADAAPALEKEAAAADAMASREAVAPAPDMAPPAAAAPLKLSPEAQPNVIQELGIEGGKLAKTQTPEEFARVSKAVFGDRVPTAEAWQNMWRVPDGYAVKIEDLGAPKVRGKTADIITVRAKITDASGADVGEMSREFSRDKAGDLVVTHDTLGILPEYQGKGIGSELSRSALESYHQLGANRIELLATGEAGPYAWAKQGYRWGEGQGEMMQDAADAYAAKKGLTPEQLSELKSAIQSGPKAVAEYSPGGQRVGKEFLLQSDGWEGQLPVAEARAEMLEKAATYARAQRAIAEADKAIADAARGIVDGPKKSPTSVSQLESGSPYRGSGRTSSVEPLKKRYEAARKTLEAAQEQQSAILARATQGNRHLPNTAAAMAMATMRALAFVSDSVPKPSVSPTLGNPMPKRVSESDMSKFMTRFDAAKDHGRGLLRQFGTGRITVQQALALKEISPEAYRQLQEDTFKVITERQAAGDPLPFNARQRTHILLGIITDPSQDPKFAKTLQANIAALSPDAQEKKQSASGGPKRNVNIKTTPSSLDRLEEK